MGSPTRAPGGSLIRCSGNDRFRPGVHIRVNVAFLFRAAAARCRDGALEWAPEPGSSALVHGASAKSGLGCVHVGNLGMATATDAAILAFAVSEKRWIVTFDADFHRLLAISGASVPTVIRIREEGLTAEPLVKLILAAVERSRAALEAGAVASVTAGRARLRALPITPPGTGRPQDG